MSCTKEMAIFAKPAWLVLVPKPLVSLNTMPLNVESNAGGTTYWKKLILVTAVRFVRLRENWLFNGALLE